MVRSAVIFSQFMPAKSDRQAFNQFGADRMDCRAILTVDARDFGIYRLKGSKRFEVVRWFDW